MLCNGHGYGKGAWDNSDAGIGPSLVAALHLIMAVGMVFGGSLSGRDQETTETIWH